MAGLSQIARPVLPAKVTIDSARRMFAMCAKGTIDCEARASVIGQEQVYESVRSPAVRFAIQVFCLDGYSRAFAPRP
jgi:hypothetical protein